MITAATLESGASVELLNADNGMSPAWSPDGSRIAFLSNRKSGWDLYTMRPDGGDLQRLTRGRAPERPAWSPDGDWIVFEREKAIEAVPAAGGEVRVLVADAGWASAPALAPLPHDPLRPPGRDLQALLAFAQRGDLYLLRIPAGAPSRLTSGGADASPAWAPGGGAIAFSRGGAIWTCALDQAGPTASGREQRLTEGSEDAEPAWSPDGATIVFVRSGALWSIPARGGPPAPLSAAPQPAGSPSFAPAATPDHPNTLAFHSYQDGNWEIMVSVPDGSQARSLTKATWVSSRPE